jgi:hypothetical protein
MYNGPKTKSINNENASSLRHPHFALSSRLVFVISLFYLRYGSLQLFCSFSFQFCFSFPRPPRLQPLSLLQEWATGPAESGASLLRASSLACVGRHSCAAARQCSRFPANRPFRVRVCGEGTRYNLEPVAQGARCRSHCVPVGR